MKKLASLLIFLSYYQLSADITSTLTMRPLSTSPLFYTMNDYSKKQSFIEGLPFHVGMYDSAHIARNIILNSKTTLVFDQQGNGDLNPAWLNLMSSYSDAYYHSQVTFTPVQSQSGLFLHFYQQHKNFFVDIKTSIVNAVTQIKIEEYGTQNGSQPGITNALQAFTQPSWNYGKIGKPNQDVGLANIQILMGGSHQIARAVESFEVYMGNFIVIEAPAGSGEGSPWLFGAEIGTNHWGLGFGNEFLMSSDRGMKFMIGGNYRFLLPAIETRSFDLIGCGQWSRYLSVQNLYGLPTAPETLGLPGINFFTQPAEIKGHSQLNMYTRLEQQIGKVACELSFNFFYTAPETIGDIHEMIPGYGIYALTGPGGGTGGVTTASKARINQDTPILDPVGNPVELTSAMFDKASAAANSYTTNTLNFNAQRVEENYVYGFGASIEVAQSMGAISSWAVWAKFEYLFSNIDRN